MATDTAAWAEVLATMIGHSHLTPAEQLNSAVNDAVRPVGLDAQVMMVDLSQRLLHPLVGGEPQPVETSLAGRAYQTTEVVASTDTSAPEAGATGSRLLWIPLMDGTERVGVMRVGLAGEVADDAALRKWLLALAGLIGHLLMTKLAHSLMLQRLRAARMSTASELMWQLLPPRTFATDRVVVSALLEPAEQVAGDAYDYAVNGCVDLAVFDGLGHDLAAGSTTSLAMSAVRNARRHGVSDLAVCAEYADAVLSGTGTRLQFVTAVLGRLDADTGDFAYLLAGHPPPLLLRDGQVVKELSHPPRPPLGIVVPGASRTGDVVGHEQLEPGDRLLFYSDGVTEARDENGEFFGVARLIDLAERAELDELSAPETLRRLVAAVLGHQRDRLQDDATLLLVQWAGRGHLELMPSPGRRPSRRPR